jgi:exodeoxyribonuclease VII small subunit
MAKKKPTQREECAASFEESLDELETIVGDLESGKLGLSEALARYELGVRHLKVCQQLLERAERKIELLSGLDADGNPITEPFDDRTLESLDEKAAARGERRRSGVKAVSANTSTEEGADMDDIPRLF